MLTGPCTLGVFYCRVCGKIFGGAANGGIIKLCRWCSIKDCDVKKLPKEEWFCSSRECNIKDVIGHYRFKLGNLNEGED